MAVTLQAGPMQVMGIGEVGKHRHAIWALTNFVDRAWLAYFWALTVLIFAYRERLPSWPQYLALHAFGVLAILALASGAPRSRMLRFLHDWYPLLAFIVGFEEVSRLSLLVVYQWRDQYILAFESRLFSTPPTVWLGEHGSWLLTEVVEIGYFGYFLLLIIVGGALYRGKDKRPFFGVMAASALSYMLCYPWYILFPTQGPAHTLRHLHTVALEGGPLHWIVLLIQRHGGVHGNAFPSSHVAAALVALIFAWKYRPRLGAWLTPVVVLLCVGAVYDRYHYVSDVAAGLVVGAIAAAIAIRYAGVNSEPRNA